MAQRSNLSEFLSEALNAILGGYARAGDLIRNPGIFTPALQSELVVPPNRTWEQEPKCRSADFGQLVAEFPASILPNEITQPGQDRIRALIVFGGNPLMALGDPTRTTAALQQLELLVVIDPRLTETAKLAHYVVAPALAFERMEVTAGIENIYSRPFAQITPAVLRKPAGTVLEEEFFWRAAGRMNLQLTLKFGNTYGDYDAIPGGLPLDRNHLQSRETLIEWLCTQAGVDFNQLLSLPHGFAPQAPLMRLREPQSDDGARLDVCPLDVARELDEASREAGAPDAPFLLVSRRIVETLNSSFRASETTRRRHPTNSIYMNPEDLAALTLTASDPVEVASESGRLVAQVRADPTVRRGVVSMTHCWGEQSDSAPFSIPQGHTGCLVSLERHLQTINRMPRQSSIPVWIRKLNSAPQPVAAAPV
jgi:anaerobic selenocysteine-containing dehydrogenase